MSPIQPLKTKLISYTGNELELIGKCTLNCMDKSLNFFVSPTSQELEIIKEVMSTKEEKDIMVRTYRVSQKKKRNPHKLSMQSLKILFTIM